MKKVMAALILCSALSACGLGYSNGSRVGTIVKVSHKGVVCKTWEVQMATNAFVSVRNEDGHVAGATNLFEFTVKDPRVLAEVKKAQQSGKQVEVRYAQWLIAPPCQNGSDYDAVSVKEIN